ncbi:MAG: DUF6931 family protein [Gemmataceae bacterium]
MSDFKHIPAATAAEAGKLAKLGDAAKALLTPALTPRQFLDALAKQGLLPDALRFLAQALPKREAVWWAGQCVRAAKAADAPPEAAALAAAEKWAATAAEPDRRAAHAAAEAATLDTPAGIVALSAFLSSGSLGPPNVAAIPPGEELTGQAVAGALQVAAVRQAPEKAAEKFQVFLNLGLAVADGMNRWPEPPKEASDGSARRPRR